MAYQAGHLGQAIYQMSDPRLQAMDQAQFMPLWQQYEGAYNLWGPDAANAVLQQQLAALPQSPVGAGSMGGPGGRGGGGGGVMTQAAGVAGGPGSQGGVQGSGATSYADIAAATAGGLASQTAPNTQPAASTNLGGRRDFTATDTGAAVSAPMPALSDNLGGRRDFTATNTGAGIPAASNNLQGRRDFTATDTGAGIPAIADPNNLQGRRDFTTADTGAIGIPASSIPATTAPNLDNQFTGDIFSPTPAPAEAAVLEWLGTQGAANLLGTGTTGTTTPMIPIPGGGGGFDLVRALGGIEKTLGWTEEQETRSMADLRRMFEGRERALPGTFNRRGMLDSGQYNRAQRRLIGPSGEKERAFGRTRYDFGEAYGSIDEAMQEAYAGESQAAFATALLDAQNRASQASDIRAYGAY